MPQHSLFDISFFADCGKVHLITRHSLSKSNHQYLYVYMYPYGVFLKFPNPPNIHSSYKVRY
jgi:hypothetical protein